MKAVGFLSIRIDDRDTIDIPIDIDTDLIVMKLRYGTWEGDTPCPDARRLLEYLLNGILTNVEPHILTLSGD